MSFLTFNRESIFNKMNKIIITLFGCLLTFNIEAQLAKISNHDTLCGHAIIHDSEQRILGWYKPEVPGAVYDKVIHLASEFLKDVPAEESTGLPMYLVTCCFEGPQFNKEKKIIAQNWPHNPACVYSGAVQSLAIRYRIYSGNDSYLNIARTMLDYELLNGTTPDDWKWPAVPYASADPFSKVYNGATKWESDGMRGDGLHGIEPDKIGEMGYAYLLFYEITNESKYLEAAVKCADALSSHVNEIKIEQSSLTPFSQSKSPWPFRVNARTGVVISEFCSNVLEPVKLLDELVRIGKRVNLPENKISLYRNVSDIAWKWLYSTSGPMTNFVWNAYFEDIPNDPGMANRLQITPIELAKYLVSHPEKDNNISTNIPSLIHWVANAFKTDGLDAIKEQTWCYEPMGSHTSRYGSACAMYYEFSGDKWYKDQAYRFLNVASYMTYENGVVAVGPNWPGSWFSDGYGDYIRHFIDAMAAIPEWVPAGENHLLRSSSVVQSVSYKTGEIDFTTFDDQGKVVLRLSTRPKMITVNGKKIEQAATNSENAWTWTHLDNGGVVKLNYTGGNQIHIVIPGET
jgi:hypothetical protein